MQYSSTSIFCVDYSQLHVIHNRSNFAIIFAHRNQTFPSRRSLLTSFQTLGPLRRFDDHKHDQILIFLMNLFLMNNVHKQFILGLRCIHGSTRRRKLRTMPTAICTRTFTDRATSLDVSRASINIHSLPWCYSQNVYDFILANQPQQPSVLNRV